MCVYIFRSVVFRLCRYKINFRVAKGKGAGVRANGRGPRPIVRFTSATERHGGSIIGADML